MKHIPTYLEEKIEKILRQINELESTVWGIIGQAATHHDTALLQYALQLQKALDKIFFDTSALKPQPKGGIKCE